jgi:predicted enzyme related to lactoylglutathione lyase
MKNNISGWFEIYVDDIARAKSFYETVFKITLTDMASPVGWEEMQMLVFPMDPSAPGATGALIKMEGFGPAVGGTIVYFTCEDCAVEQDRAEAAGGIVIKPKESIGENGFISLIKDTEGNIIGLHSMK